MTADRPLDVAQQTEELAEQIEALKQQEIIEAEKAESLEQEPDEIRADASGEDSAKTWEGSIISRTRSQRPLRKLPRTWQRPTQLGEADALSNALMEGSQALDSKLLTESMKELSDLTDAAADDDRLLDGDLSQETLDRLKAGTLYKEQLKELSAMLGKAKGRLAERLKELRKAGLIDLKTLKKCESAGQCDSDGLAAFLAENGDECRLPSFLHCGARRAEAGSVGVGGTRRCRWSDGTSELGAKFKEQLLSPSALAGLKDSQLVGHSVGTHSRERRRAQSGALSGASSGSGSAFTQTVLPRHKRAVKRYFERP